MDEVTHTILPNGGGLSGTALGAGFGGLIGSWLGNGFGGFGGGWNRGLVWLMPLKEQNKQENEPVIFSDRFKFNYCKLCNSSEIPNSYNELLFSLRILDR